MAWKEPEEMLRLTVPRRNIVLALLAVSKRFEHANPRVHFRPENPEATERITKGSLLTVAICGHLRVELLGGTWEGKWFKKRDVRVFPPFFAATRHQGVDAHTTLRVFANGDLAVADDTIGRPWPLAMRCPRLLPTWTAGLRPREGPRWRCN